MRTSRKGWDAKIAARLAEHHRLMVKFEAHGLPRLAASRAAQMVMDGIPYESAWTVAHLDEMDRKANPRTDT